MTEKIQKTNVSTAVFEAGLENNEIPVWFSDRIEADTIYELSYCSRIGGYLPYLFAGYFSAVQNLIGNGFDFSYCQLHFDEIGLSRGKLQIKQIIIGKLKNQQEAFPLLRNAIDQKFMASKVEITFNNAS